MAESETPLSFHTTLTGRPITIDGRPYEIRHPESFSIRDTGLVEIQRIRIFEFLAKVRTPEEDVALEQMLIAFCQLVITAPPEVVARLSPAQLLEAATAFLELRPRHGGAVEAAATATAAPMPPGSPSFLDSADSSAAAPGTGGPPTPLH